MSATLDNADAFLLLTLSNCTLVAGATHLSGSLALECVTIQVPDAPPGGHVYLVLRMDDTEIPIDPAQIVRTNLSESGARKYTFLPTATEPVEFAITIAVPNYPDAHFLENVEIFETIIAQYADLRGELAHDTPDLAPNIYEKAGAEDLRGHLVLVNQDNGEVVGEFDKKFSVQEDPTLSKKGHEGDTVVIEIPEGTDDDEYNANALEIFARAIPPDQQDWITKGATIISHAISGSTTLLLTAISAGSSYYMSHSKPSTQRAASTSSVASSGSSAPPPLPPRAVAFLSSARTRQGLAAVHSVSGQAVKVSAKTVAVIDGMIKAAIGSSKGKGRAQATPGLTPGRPTLPPRASSPTPSSLAPPPPYTSSAAEKPPLPPRRQPSPSPSRSSSPLPPSLPPRKSGGPSGSGEPTPAGERVTTKLSNTTRILLSADLILSTLDNSTRRILDSGTQNLGTVVGHKYGAEAAQSSVLMAGTVRNVALVYIDMRGIGRRALLRRAGKEFVKGRIEDRKLAQASDELERKKQ
ncbi:hypothetical protein DFH06DRAFT_1155820 [Mycena polygramma]|nr:hypothetical protein DFH06DRAFT_1155820 [Mycena polygramma]